MDISKIITPTLVASIKSTSKFELAIDKLIMVMDKGGICPPKKELGKVAQTKNQITGALNSVSSALGSLESTANTADSIVQTVKGAIITIKATPFPTSVPPGIGVPANVLTLLSDGLDLLGKLIDKVEGPISSIATALSVIKELIDAVIAKLGILDGLFNNCLIQEIQNEIIWSPTVDYVVDNKVSWQELYWTSISGNKNKQPDISPDDWQGTTEDDALSESGSVIIEEIGVSSSDTGLFSPSSSLGGDQEGTGSEAGGDDMTGADFNEQAEIDLENALTPPPGVLVDPYYLMLEYNPEDTYAPSRGMKATHKDDENNKLLNKFSFSATAQVLFDEMKFRVENIDSGLNLEYMERGGDETIVDTETTSSGDDSSTPPVWQPNCEKWRSYQDNYDIEGALGYLQEGINTGIGLSGYTLQEVFELLRNMCKVEDPVYNYLYPDDWVESNINGNENGESE